MEPSQDAPGCLEGPSCQVSVGLGSQWVEMMSYGLQITTGVERITSSAPKSLLYYVYFQSIL